jgi:hypothetical protein
METIIIGILDIDILDFYNVIYDSAKLLVSKTIDDRFLKNGLLIEFSQKNKIKSELFDHPDDFTCPVCYNEKDTDAIYFKLECGHILCGPCFASLLINYYNTCPMCRAEIVLENCKINKHIDDTAFSVSEDEIDDMASEYTYDYITNIHSSFLL